MDLAKLVEIIPKLFLYIIPGYIAIFIKQKSKHEKEDNQSHIVIMSIIISFIIVEILDGLIGIINLMFKLSLNLEIYNNIRTLIILILSVLFGIAWSFYKGSKIDATFKKVVGDNSIDEPSVWNYAMKCNKGAWVRVYLYEHNIAYLGKLIYYTIDPNDERKEILLASYTSRDISSARDLENFDDDNKMVLINCKDIKNIEILKG